MDYSDVFDFVNRDVMNSTAKLYHEYDSWTIVMCLILLIGT